MSSVSGRIWCFLMAVFYPVDIPVLLGKRSKLFLCNICSDCVCVFCCPSVMSVHIRPWVLGPVGSPPPSSAVTFASIVEEEKQQQAALIRSREKPLALIQVTPHVRARCAFFHRPMETTAGLDFNTCPPINPSACRHRALTMGWFRRCCDSSLCSRRCFPPPPPSPDTVSTSFS